MMSLILNMFLCLDLTQQIYSPFTPPGKNNKLYYTIAFMMAFILSGAVISQREEGWGTCVGQYKEDH
jgi:hypothetical protein